MSTQSYNSSLQGSSFCKLIFIYIKITIPHNCYSTQLLFHTITIPHNYYSTQLLFHTITIPHNCHSTQLLFHTITIPHNYYSTQLLFHTITIPHNYYSTQLLFLAAVLYKSQKSVLKYWPPGTFRLWSSVNKVLCWTDELNRRTDFRY
jgi:hypothetical protein